MDETIVIVNMLNAATSGVTHQPIAVPVHKQNLLIKDTL